MSAAVTQTVILAAGSGSRLAHGSNTPKPLTTVAGLPLVAHALAHARASGCREAVVVVGYEACRVRAAVEALAGGLVVRFVENADAASPNGDSLLAAEPLTAPAFFLQMVDHLFAAPALSKLVRAPLTDGLAGRLLVDVAPIGIDLEDATRVRVQQGRVSAIGKNLQPWDAVDTGCFVLTHAVFTALRTVPATEPRTVSAGMRRLAAAGALEAVSIDGVRWVDVDTPADRAAAELIAQQSVAVAGTPSAAAPLG